MALRHATPVSAEISAENSCRFRMSGQAGRPSPPYRMQYPPNGFRNYPFSTCAIEVLRLISANACGKNALAAFRLQFRGESTVGRITYPRSQLNSPFNLASIKYSLTIFCFRSFKAYSEKKT